MSIWLHMWSQAIIISNGQVRLRECRAPKIISANHNLMCSKNYIRVFCKMMFKVITIEYKITLLISLQLLQKG